MEELSKLGSKVRFETNQETNQRGDGHVLDSYIMLYLGAIAQLVEPQVEALCVGGSIPPCAIVV